MSNADKQSCSSFDEQVDVFHEFWRREKKQSITSNSIEYNTMHERPILNMSEKVGVDQMKLRLM